MVLAYGADPNSLQDGDEEKQEMIARKQEIEEENKRGNIKKVYETANNISQSPENPENPFSKLAESGLLAKIAAKTAENDPRKIGNISEQEAEEAAQQGVNRYDEIKAKTKQNTSEGVSAENPSAATRPSSTENVLANSYRDRSNSSGRE